MTARFCIRGVGIAMLALSLSMLLPVVRSAWQWGVLSWSITLFTLLLPGAWLIANTQATFTKRLAVMGMGFLSRLGFLGAGIAVAALQGSAQTKSFLITMAISYLMLQGFELIALKNSLKTDEPMTWDASAPTGEGA